MSVILGKTRAGAACLDLFAREVTLPSEAGPGGQRAQAGTPFMKAVPQICIALALHGPGPALSWPCTALALHGPGSALPASIWHPPEPGLAS